MIRVSKIAFGLRVMRAGVGRIDCGALGSQQSSDLRLHGCEFGPAIIAAADARLVCDHDYRNASPVRGDDDFRGSWNYPDVLGPVQIFGLLNDGTIAIQEQGRPARCRSPQNLAPDTLRIERMFSRPTGFEHCG